MMRLILAFLIALLPILNGNSTTLSDYSMQNEVVYSDWQLSNQGCYGCSSFYWKVTKSVTSDGYYHFKIWFYSNSFYTNGTRATTYIHGLVVFADKAPVTNPDGIWITVYDAFNPALLDFYTINPSPYIYLRWGGHRIY